MIHYAGSDRGPWAAMAGSLPLRCGLFLALVLLGLGLRSAHLPTPPLWVDEAESTLNALAIIEHGLPLGEHLGLPVYENTLLRPWPGHPEYAFQDVSYTRDGIAIYHGWLPLYAIAASLRLFGVDSTCGPGPPPACALADLRWRTVVPRLPALLFSVGLFVLVFLLARSAFGEAAAWTALIAVILSDSMIWFGSQARYYALTLLLTAAVLLLVLRLARHGRRRDYIVALPVYVALFYTHLLSFFVAVIVFLAVLPWLWRHPGWWRHLLWFTLAGVSLTLPWLLWTGYLDYLGEIPRAWPLLEFPRDLLVYPRMKLDYVMLYALGAGFVLWLWWGHGWETGRLGERMPVLPLYLLSVWMLAAYLAYLLLIPAPSFFFNRLSLVLVVPGIVLAAATLALVARAMAGNAAIIVAPMAFLAFGLGFGRISLELPVAVAAERYAPLSALQSLELSPPTRWYATPNDQLVLSYYTGLPFQSIAPVRKQFLDRFPGAVVLVERVFTHTPEDSPIAPPALLAAARGSGVSLSPAAARQLSSALSNRHERERLAASGARLIPPLEPLPVFAQAPLAAQAAVLARGQAEWAAREAQAPIFQGFELHDWQDWWQVFFYRFIDPETRRGAGLNSRERLADASVFLPPGSPWKITLSSRPVGLDAGPGSGAGAGTGAETGPETGTETGTGFTAP